MTGRLEETGLTSKGGRGSGRNDEAPLPRVGDTASFTKTITETDVVLFAGLTGDFNPAHIDSEAAARGFFRARVAHGMLTASLISTVLGTRLPGPGTIYLSQGLRFTAPVYLGDTVTARAEVTEVDEAKRRVRLRTWCTNQHEKVVIEGEALTMVPSP